jgi:TPR repeat protein
MKSGLFSRAVSSPETIKRLNKIKQIWLKKRCSPEDKEASLENLNKLIAAGCLEAVLYKLELYRRIDDAIILCELSPIEKKYAEFSKTMFNDVFQADTDAILDELNKFCELGALVPTLKLIDIYAAFYKKLDVTGLKRYQALHERLQENANNIFGKYSRTIIGLLKRASMLGDGESSHILGMIYQNGKHERFPDLNAAIDIENSKNFLEISVNQGYASAQIAQNGPM